jgi:hypothetical protein
MLASLVANLANGGTLVVLVPNPDLDWDRLDVYPRYGLSVATTEVSAGRQGYSVHIDGDPPIDFEGFAWPPGVVEPALARAGLTGVRRHPVSVPADAVADHAPDYWADLLANPTFAVFTATRQQQAKLTSGSAWSTGRPASSVDPGRCGQPRQPSAGHVPDLRTTARFSTRVRLAV